MTEGVSRHRGWAAGTALRPQGSLADRALRAIALGLAGLLLGTLLFAATPIVASALATVEPTSQSSASSADGWSVPTSTSDAALADHLTTAPERVMAIRPQASRWSGLKALGSLLWLLVLVAGAAAGLAEYRPRRPDDDSWVADPLALLPCRRGPPHLV